MANPLKEIANKRHRNFMKEYIREWPFLPQTDFMIGETVNAELNGVQQKCVVEAVDCSLIQVLFLVSTCNHDKFSPDIFSTFVVFCLQF